MVEHGDADRLLPVVLARLLDVMVVSEAWINSP
jgi:hypothetical protein